MEKNILDILIIGGGPIGLTCGIEAHNNQLNYLIIEKGCLVNSLYNYPINMTFFSTSEKLEIGGVPFVSTQPKPKRAEALEYYRRVHQKFDLKTHFFEEVIEVKKTDGIFHVLTNKRTYLTQHVVVATGFYDTPIYLNIPGEELPKVKHYYQDPHYYANMDVAVVGASNSAIDAALETYRKGANVTLVIRGGEIGPRVKYWVRPDIENRLAEGSINAYFHSTVQSVSDRSITVQTPNGPVTLENDFVIAMTGYQPNFNFLTSLGIELEGNRKIPMHNRKTMETNVPGMYLAGVVCGGLDTHLWFIENSRIHAKIILNDILKKTPKPIS